MKINETVFRGRPKYPRTPVEEAIYDKLDELEISFLRVDHEHADTMEDCREVERVLGTKICKNLLLTNRQQTRYYLLMLPGDKVFKTKDLSAQLGVARLSFAGPEAMERLLRTTPGSVSALELLFDTGHEVTLVMDKELAEDSCISGHPGISTSTLRLFREDMMVYLSEVGHSPVYVDLPRASEEPDGATRTD
ncbi:MAG: prolyl-tRNA synthetase associated domain-containing protein [Candidatus Onthomonas sp.]